MPSPERPERSIPDIASELTEVADAQDVKVETQKSRFAELDCSKLRLAKEAEDVLRIAYENSSDPEKFILEVIEDYAKSEKVSLLAAKAMVLQYLSPEWKEKVDAEVKEYFVKFDLNEFVRLPAGSEESADAIKTLRILCDEGYMPYFVIAVHYHADPEVKKQTLSLFEGFPKMVKTVFDKDERKTFEEKENFVLDSKNVFPEARKYLDGMKNTKPKEEYEYVINLAYKYLILGLITGAVFPAFDCDESTFFLQKMATDESLEIGDYMETVFHFVLKLNGLPLVLDTFDKKIRTVEECARRDGYGDGENGHGSYFWRDSRGKYLAQYEDSDHYPRKITGYERVKKPYLFERGGDMAGLLDQSAVLLESFGDVSGAKLHYEKALEIAPDDANAHYNLANLLRSSGDIPGAKLHYEKSLEIAPDYVFAHNNFAILLKSSGDVSGAKLHYEKSLEIAPNYAITHNNFAILLESSGDVSGAKLHYEKSLEIDPNYADAHYNLAILFYEQGEMGKAREHLNKCIELSGGKFNESYEKLDEDLKEKGY